MAKRSQDQDQPASLDASHDGGEFAELTRQLGDRVRRFRASRGMSRKVLSQLSGVSERYLAQLECGQANVSFHILWTLSQTMDVQVTDMLQDSGTATPDLVLAKKFLESLPPDSQSAAYALLRQHFGGGRRASTCVALIGLRGGGKTTLGRLLARHYDVPFVRLTSLVEETAGMELPEIFVTLGQKGYRRLELNALQTTLTQHPRAVIETGGSIVSEATTFQTLLSNCFTVWIQASPQEHMDRVVAQGDIRPMEGHQSRAMEDLKAILEARSAFYCRADASVDTAGRPIDACARDLIDTCAPYLEKAAFNRTQAAISGH